MKKLILILVILLTYVFTYAQDTIVKDTVKITITYKFVKNGKSGMMIELMKEKEKLDLGLITKTEYNFHKDSLVEQLNKIILLYNSDTYKNTPKTYNLINELKIRKIEKVIILN